MGTEVAQIIQLSSALLIYVRAYQPSSQLENRTNKKNQTATKHFQTKGNIYIAKTITVIIK
jgi:hypothetical protein